MIMGYKSIVEQIEQLMKDLDRMAARSRKQGDYNWENICNARIIGLIDARRIVLDEMEKASGKVDIAAEAERMGIKPHDPIDGLIGG